LAARGDGLPQQAAADAAAERALDWLNLFVGNIQTGFGPFIAVYLTTRGWTETSIGLALSLGTLAAMASQMPAGALVDAIRKKARVVLASILAFSVSALLFAVNPAPLAVYVAETLHSFSSCTLSPAIAAVSLGVAGPALLGLRFGRNARFAAIGNGLGAVLMGACGYYVSERAVFFLTAALTLPALVPLAPLARADYSARPAAGTSLLAPASEPPLRVLGNRGLVVLAAAAMLFTLGNAAILPLVGNTLTRTVHNQANLVIAACIVVPQAVLAMVSPRIGRLAETRGRRPLLLLGLITLPVRAAVFAVTTATVPIVLIQMLDGLAGACIGVLVPLVTSDVAGRSGRYNLALGTIGFAIGIGATLSTGVAGWIGDRLGQSAAFATLAGFGLAACAIVFALMPETRPGSRKSNAGVSVVRKSLHRF
jgi:MFS family permease